MIISPTGAVHQPQLVHPDVRQLAGGNLQELARRDQAQGEQHHLDDPEGQSGGAGHHVPAARSDIAVTIKAPGSSTASEARAVRSGPSSSPASAAANSPQPDERRQRRHQGGDQREPPGQSRQPGHEDACQRREQHVRRTRLQDQADSGRRDDQPDSAAQAGYLRGRPRRASSCSVASATDKEPSSSRCRIARTSADWSSRNGAFTDSKVAGSPLAR